jgi:hypothetical protein
MIEQKENNVNRSWIIIYNSIKENQSKQKLDILCRINGTYVHIVFLLNLLKLTMVKS